MYSHSDYDPLLSFVEVTGSEVNRGAGYGLCINRQVQTLGVKRARGFEKAKMYT